MSTLSSTNYALAFDGVNDLVRANQVVGVGPLTIEAWVRPGVASATGLVVVAANDNTGWSLELTNGLATFWLATNQGWQSVQHATALPANQWSHVAATYAAGSARVFVNGVASNAATVGTLTQGPALRFGGLAGYPFLNATLDEVCISNIARYTVNFAPPASLALDANTIGLWTFNAGSGQTATDASPSANHATLGATSASGADDPLWVGVTR